MPNWTYGLELELPDIKYDKSLQLFGGCSWDYKDGTIANTNGIANDPTKKDYQFGSEINTRPTTTLVEQAEIVEGLYKQLRVKKVNHTCNMHVHIGTTGLEKDLVGLQRVLGFITETQDDVFSIIDPGYKSTRDMLNGYLDAPGFLEMADKRLKRRRQSHHGKLSAERTERALSANTIDEFFLAHVPLDKNGRGQFQLFQRPGINLTSLYVGGTQTIEFRHFNVSLDVNRIYKALQWCQHYLEKAMNNDTHDLFSGFMGDDLPKLPEFNPIREQLFRQTSFLKNKRATAKEMIEYLTINDKLIKE